MTPDELAEWIRVAPWLVAAVLLVMLAVWAVRKVAPVLRKLGHLVDDLVGEPARPGVAARPGLMERMTAVEDKTEIIRHEMFPNSGKSLRDKLDQTSEVVDEISTDMTDVKCKLDNDNRRIAALDQRVTAAIKTIEENHPHE